MIEYQVLNFSNTLVQSWRILTYISSQKP